jgi:hypothetical protein
LAAHRRKGSFVPDFRLSFAKRILDAPAAALAALGTRIEYGRRAEGDPLPALNINVVSDPRPLHFKGDQELRQSRFQVDVFAATIKEAIEIAEAAIEAVKDPADVDGIHFERATIEGPETSGDQETGLYVNRARFDALAWHKPI